MSNHIVILGSGQAGTSTVRELRKLAPEVAVTLISSDDCSFYAKPTLSNAIAAGKNAAQLVVTPAEKLAEQLKLTLMPHTHVESIDISGKQLITDQGPVPYDTLVLANGAHPIRLPLTGSGADDVISVNHLSHYAAFRERLKPGMRVAILGAGLIGCEFANDLRAADHAVTVFDLAQQPLGRLLPPKAGAFFAAKLSAAGVKFEFGTSIVNVDKDGSAYLLSTADGRQFEADLVLSAIGLKPAVELAAAAGLKVNRGIVVDRQLQTSAPNIYAIGDCAEVEGLVLPFILPIMNAARALGKTLAGTPTDLAYPAMPVVVKTPACPTVVSPPAMGAAGAWVEEEIEGGIRALFKAPDGKLLGCALLGEASKERQAVATQLPPVL
ncbi:MAG: FAD-dependent oxidoreductase [Rhodocyclaceae bacterium]|nr:FAD-dependent oxidoreductase [Rhodocyclaceae bacterium]